MYIFIDIIYNRKERQAPKDQCSVKPKTVFKHDKVRAPSCESIRLFKVLPPKKKGAIISTLLILSPSAKLTLTSKPDTAC